MMDKMQWDAFQKERLSETEVRKFVLCESKEEDSTRLFIHQFSRWSSALTKEGWWDTFTLSRKPCAKGFYLCQIENFRIDKNGYLNMMVFPNKFLGEAIDEDNIAWDYLQLTGRFSQEYKNMHWRERFNTANLHSVFQERFEESGYPTMESFIFSSFMLGDISLEEIADALEEKYEIEKLAEDINHNPQKYAEKYPLLIKKLPKEEFMGFMAYNTSCTISFLQDKSFEYARLKLGTESNLFVQVEEVLKHWDDVHKLQKEKKKQQKKLLKKRA